jgi:hypothetical protein
MQKTKSKLVNGFIISTFVGLYAIVSVISTIHVIEFFELSNPKWLAISLAVAFEIGAAASLASLIVLDKMNKLLVWILFIVLTCMQAMGNTYYAYTHIHDFQSWSELFGLIEEDVIYQKRLLSIISGAILPLVALGFIKSLVDYIKPEEVSEQAEGVSEQTEEDVIIDLNQTSEAPIQISENLPEQVSVQESEPQPESESKPDPVELPLEPVGEIVQSVNRSKAGYVSTDYDPTKIS